MSSKEFKQAFSKRKENKENAPQRLRDKWKTKILSEIQKQKKKILACIEDESKTQFQFEAKTFYVDRVQGCGSDTMGILLGATFEEEILCAVKALGFQSITLKSYYESEGHSGSHWSDDESIPFRVAYLWVTLSLE